MPLSSSFKNIYGPWAAITGASAGIGAECARQLAAAGLNIAIIARRTEKLNDLRNELKQAHGVDIRVITADLYTPAGWHTVIDDTAELDVGLFICNAAIERIGAFLAYDADTHASLVDLNVGSTTVLSHAFSRRFVARMRAVRAQNDAGGSLEPAARRAGFIFVSSMLNTATPYFATYAASKAYMSALAGALSIELGKEGIDVTVLESAAVVTEMTDRAKEVSDFASIGFPAMQPEQSVRETLAAFEAGRAVVIPGVSNKAIAVLWGVLPRDFRLDLMGKQMMKAVIPSLTENPVEEESHIKPGN